MKKYMLDPYLQKSYTVSVDIPCPHKEKPQCKASKKLQSE